ncbi:MAG: TonB-dependent receptor [Methylophilales bacterium]|nr:TonB-dependent receptor [Methylophilales bacterium]
MKRHFYSGLLCLAYFSFSFAEPVIQTNEVLVTATGIARPDTETTYASELHTNSMIESSGATSLYDYFAQHTSINILPSFGNKVTPQIDMRGYGSGSGYQNIVVTVDGQRLNNVDLVPQFISAIPLGDIDRIEITKGSGSVMFGDGASAGSIQIYTKARTRISVSVSAGNHGAASGFVSAGVSEKYFDLSASVAHDSDDGLARADITNHRDSTRNNAQRIKLKIKPVDVLRFNLEVSNSSTDTRYINALTFAQFNADPRQAVGTYTHQAFTSRLWRMGSEFDITPEIKLSLNRSQEDKVSDFIAFANKSKYDYTSNDITFQYQGGKLATTLGLQTFDGLRIGATNNTSKDNIGVFAQAEYRFDAFSVSAGARREKVDYEFVPAVGAALKDTRYLNAWDVGVNYRLNLQTSVFANYNQAFQAPDIDRFFTFVGAFNGFITPQTSRTLNLGVNHNIANNRFKFTLFRAELDNEIYFDPVSFINTNIDQSHKYGLEVQDQWQITERLSSALIYTYTRAIMDKASQGAGAFDGKNLPGVPKHGITASLNFSPLANTNINVSHTWRSSAFSINDFANNFTQRQNNYQSTNLALSYQYKNLQWFATVNNLFEHKNALFVQDDAIYPVDYSRQVRIGMKADF